MQKKAGWETKHHKCQHSLFPPEKQLDVGIAEKDRERKLFPSLLEARMKLVLTQKKRIPHLN